MGLTNFNGLANYGIPVIGGAMPLAATQGKVIHVKPSSGLDGNSGTTPGKAVQTLAKALELATAGKNDIVLLYAESDTASSTTDYQTTTLDWNKDMVHIIGVSAGGGISQRARVAFTALYDTASNLFTLSANACIISGVHFYAGVAGTNPTGCVKVTGHRNRFINCHIAGIGNNANDIAGAYSLSIAAGAENYFDSCTIGLDTIARGSAANADIIFTSAATRNVFRNCTMLAFAEHATNYNFVNVNASGAIDRFVLFDNCLFHNAIKSTATLLTQAMTVHATAGGTVILKDCSVIGATDWQAVDTGLVFANSPIASAPGAGLQLAVTR